MLDVNAVRGAVQVKAIDSSGNVTGPITLSGWKEFEVDNNSFLSADTFSLSLAANALPAQYDANWITAQTQLFFEFFAGIPPDPSNWSPSDLTSWLYGQSDKLEFDPEKGVIEFRGRDLTRVFIDAKTTEKFQNKTSSQIAQILAARHGLTANVVATTTQVGKFYEIDHDKMTSARTEWDVLTELARNEQYVVYVRGQTLNFVPKPTSTTPTYTVAWSPPDQNGYPTCNVKGLRFERALTVSKGIVVVVQSWHDAQGKAFKATYPPNKASTAKPGEPGSGNQTYYFNKPNMTQQQALMFAQSKYAELVQHEMKADFQLPGAGNDGLDVMSVVQIKNTGTAFDQLYYPDSLKRKMSFDDGYTLDASLKNHSPDSQEEDG